jgi:hypothetical protein
MTNHGRYIVNGLSDVRMQKKHTWKFRYDRCFVGFSIGTGKFIEYLAPVCISSDIVQNEVAEKRLTRVLEPQPLPAGRC